MSAKKALIIGVSGQDGAYLSKLLLNKGYQVFGSSRDAQVSIFKNLSYLGIREKITTVSMAVNDFRSVAQILKEVEPDEIYNLAGQTSVTLSFDQPVEAMESIAGGTLHILEAIRFLDKSMKLYNASSSECFGQTPLDGADEQTAFRPRSPYAVAKASSFWSVKIYREAYGIYASNGILFNHESPLRPDRFVTMKIVSTAVRIAQGSQEMLLLGNMDIQRDWGWAPEYVEAMWLIMQQDHPDDYVISTGICGSLEDFLKTVFEELNLDWHDYVKVDEKLFRASEIMYSRGKPKKALNQLEWRARYNLRDVARMMVAEQKKVVKG